MKRLAWIASVVIVVIVAVALVFAANVALGMRAHARVSGTIVGLGLRSPVAVLRDGRGVPHISAANEHDLFFAQGYAEGSDRLFQMDLLRRFISGNLAAVMGSAALPSDEVERAVPVRDIVERQWRHAAPATRDILTAFSDGVNAAIEREPLPVEFRILAYRPAPWKPRDSLAIGMALALDLIDDWNDIEPRDAAYRAGGLAGEARAFPLSDPCYDAAVVNGLPAIGPGQACTLPERVATLVRELSDARPPVGSNAFAAGAKHTRTGRSLLANDPHLGLHIPGWWYLTDLRAPDLHVAGASLPGLPCVVLGHNEHLAWGFTDGTVASLSAFTAPARLDPSGWKTEAFDVRFRRGPVEKRYYRTQRYFGVTTNGGKFVLIDWPLYTEAVSPAQTFVDLDRQNSIEGALATLARFPGPTHNVVLADSSGRAAYQLAGVVPNDPVWSRWFHPAGDVGKVVAPLPHASLPHVPPSSDAVLWTANNLMYGARYPWRLSPQFAAPYRAYRIAQLLRERTTYDVAAFEQIQMDVRSLPEFELARNLAKAVRAADPAAAAALARWNGDMNSDSTEATVAQALRLQVTQRFRNHMMPALAASRRDDGAIGVDPLPSPAPWGVAGATPVKHALSALGIGFLDGTTLPGNGDAFTPHVQYTGYSQSFRAVWDVGNWDAGGITLPEGESGEPGSGHYVDEAPAWIAGRLLPLPFSGAAVDRAAVDRLVLSS